MVGYRSAEPACINAILMNVRDPPVNQFQTTTGWNLQALTQWLPLYIVSRINTIHVDETSNGPDCVIWRHTANGTFTIKSAYFCQVTGSPQWYWDYIWRLALPPEISTFMWLLVQGKCNEPSCWCGIRSRGGRRRLEGPDEVTTVE